MYLGSRTLGERDMCMVPGYSSIVGSTLLTNFLRILGSYSFSPFVAAEKDSRGDVPLGSGTPLTNSAWTAFTIIFGVPELCSKDRPS